jgi:hypothetical protein
MSWGYLQDHRLRLWRACPAIAVLLALALCACSSGGGFGGPVATASAPAPAPAPPPTTTAAPSPPPSTTSSSLSSKLTSLFSRSSANSQQGVANAPPQTDLDCPLIDIRDGASTLQLPPPVEDQNSTMALKYQGTFVRAARECALINNQMVMKIGVEGRLIVGPAGGPGQVEVPLRIAIVDETIASTKPIATKLVEIPVTVAPGQDSTTFAHVEDAMSFPMPSAADLENYIVYIGFDPLGAAAQAKEQEKPKARAKPKAKTAAPSG